MIRSPNGTNNLALDANNLADLRVAAKQNSPEALKATAKQFEALFVNMMMKSMRDATPQDGIGDSDQSKMFTSMLDEQMSQKIANRGIGLADVLVRQMTQNPNGRGGQKIDQAAEPAAADKTPINTSMAPKSQAPHVKAFQDSMRSHAEAASRATGIPAKFMLGQAALESGWGKHEIKAADGSASHNLFGIKATAGWTGKTVSAPTTEYINGVPRTVMQKFRAYDSYGDAFKDYANMLASNPRYDHLIASAHDATSFAQGLQRAGYATDPHYAAKLSNIINRTLV
ncbi:MAG: flagellar assembly peptidoglycan hydrolase FlgJ [Burkholderiaceae bacterium]|nr:flagellar assembly peptidoglycan hydrolase FlgJ [Burkholderiaceae bacterium]